MQEYPRPWENDPVVQLLESDPALDAAPVSFGDAVPSQSEAAVAAEQLRVTNTIGWSMFVVLGLAATAGVVATVRGFRR